MKHLPIEIYEGVAKSLRHYCDQDGYKSSKVSLYNLCLVDKKWYHAATPSLYRKFESRVEGAFFKLLRTIIERPNLGIHVKSVFLSYSKSSMGWEDRTLRDTIRSRALALGLPLSDHPDILFYGSISTLSRDFQDALKGMLLLHTPYLTTVNFGGQVDTRHSNPYRYLDIVARCSQWHGMKCLRHLRLGVQFPIDGPESYHEACLSTLATAFPSAQHLYLELKYSGNRSSGDLVPASSKPEMSTSTHVVTFLGNLRSIYINNPRGGSMSFERTLGKHVDHCTGVEGVFYNCPQAYAAPFVQLMWPLSRTLKRLRVIQTSHEPNETISDALDSDPAALIDSMAGPTSLEVLYFHMLPYGGLWDLASTMASFMRALPATLRVLSIDGCKSGCLTRGLTQLVDRVQDGMLPNFCTLYVGPGFCPWSYSFMSELRRHGVNVEPVP
ncbi:hypothetical protein LX32DRAFT_587455 [Colletotrichum zoysiae]|uniref:Uncharacterized protein n=1 Tax=Colletotrichum zoysiae TaxID=1216348 RepID=A0AAD9M5U7_9PEZI|nr:hypothetical protein LX32DRAFT_587455 [Colletotrichum zoysiae]